ncbi:MAG: sporulation protein YqfC [Bacillota bacterium]|nr:MAG: sporulation protein YqfC [Bacillota bacterium]
MPRKKRGRWRRVKTQEELREERLERRRVKLRQKERFGRGVASLFEIPEDIVLNLPRVTIIGNLQMIIENHRGLVEYSPTQIRVAAGNGQLTITGNELAIGSVFTEDLSIMGRFASVTFEEMTPELPEDKAQRGPRS